MPQWVLLVRHFSGKPRPQRAAGPWGARSRSGLGLWLHQQRSKQAALVALEDTLTCRLGREAAASGGLLGAGGLCAAVWRGVEGRQVVGAEESCLLSLPHHWAFRSHRIGAPSQSESCDVQLRGGPYSWAPSNPK